MVGNGGASVSGWSASGKGGQGRYTAIGIANGNDGTGGSGGGSTGVCNGASTCTSATTAHVVTVASGGGGGGESMCSGTDAGNGGQAGNAGTTATSSSKGKGLSGTTGTNGAAWAITGDGIARRGRAAPTTRAPVPAALQEVPVGKARSRSPATAAGAAVAVPATSAAPAVLRQPMTARWPAAAAGGSSWVASGGSSTTFGTGCGGEQPVRQHRHRRVGDRHLLVHKNTVTRQPRWLTACGPCPHVVVTEKK